MSHGNAEEVSADSVPEAPELTEEQRFEVRQRIEALDKVFASQNKAKYKLELLFGKARSLRRPVPGLLSFWSSGSQLHGGGDTKIYLCPGEMLKRNTCTGVIPDTLIGYGFLVCPSCQTTWKEDEVIGEILGNHTMQDWADLLYRYFRRLEHNCDIYLKHSPDDIRSAAAREQERQRGGEVLMKSRKRARHVYPLQNIIKDTSNGADVLKRFYAFLTS